jgi:uncharacterized protein YjbI with pentapeptide repeats
MANPEHLEILKQGVEVWNDWRKKYPDIQPFLVDADLSGIDLSGVHFRLALLGRVKFNHSNLSRANLVGAMLSGADFSYADLSHGKLNTTTLISTNFNYANLNHADLSYANFRSSFLSGADFTNSYWQGTNAAEVDLSEAIGLESVNHYAPSTIGIDTLYLSAGKIPEVFLRGCGVPENFITYMHSLTGKALDFYKCFISFTEADDLFSERLYNDLQGAGVRCWRWKEDAKWGKTLMSSIDEAVHYYDKLIIICSEQSLNSPAVIREIERALQKEDDLARHDKEPEVLFPIRLDDYIFEWNHHRRADVIAKNVGDFRHWNEPEKYKKAFDRLLRDLKAEEKKEPQTAEG